ncbi:MAG: hypothetical protein FJY82_04570 [Candidatus Aminicenantes bacterium]|nr:hypothetical protein [Candidatus Aminicenantes bacterium]
MELVRRWALLAAAALAVLTAKAASTGPLFVIRVVDFAEAQGKESAWTDQGRYLAQLPLEEYVRVKTKDAVLPVAGEDWAGFLEEAGAASRGELGTKAWMSRIPADSLRWKFTPYRVFFRPDEEPLRGVAGSFSRDEETRYLVAAEGGKPVYLSLTYQVYDRDAFGFGGGFTGSPKPPTRFLYPFRKYSLWILFAGFIAYVVLPRVRPKRDELYYARWRIILGDFASMILFVPFFAVPIFVIGGSVQAVTLAWPLTLVCWPLAFVGIWLLRLQAWYATYRLALKTDGIELSTYKGKRLFRFAEMSYHQPVRVKPPRWLVIASWLAALAGKGSARVGAAGRAMMLSGSASDGVGIGLKDGSKAFFWVSDQMGGQALKNAGRMLKDMEKAGVPLKDEVKVIESVTLPVGEDARGRTIREGGGTSLALLFLLPIAALVIVSILAWFGRSRSAGKVEQAVKEEAEALRQPLAGADSVWTASLGQGDITVGRALLATADGGFAVGGYAASEGMNIDFFLAKVDGEGKVLWTKTYGEEEPEYGYLVSPAGDGGYFLGGERRGTAGGVLGGSSDAVILKTDSEGAMVWLKTWGAEEQDELPLALAPGAKGGPKALIRTPNGVSVVEWDAEGTVVKDETFVLLSQFDNIEGIKAGAFTGDGGFVLTGEEQGPSGAFLDAFIARCDAQGKVIWKQKSGGPGKESGRAVIALADGGFAAAGVVNVFDQDGEDVYVLRTDAEGEVEGEYAHGGPGDQSGESLLQTASGDLIVVGRAKDGDAPSGVYLTKIVRGQVEIGDKRVGGEPYGAEGAALALSRDGGYVILANRTTSGFSTTAAELLKIGKI